MFDRLIGREVNGAVSCNGYDGVHVKADYDEFGSVTARYLYGAGIDNLVARWQPDTG